MSTQRTFTVGFTRLDGSFRHAEVKQGTKLGALLKKFGYSDSELAAAVRDVRVNGDEISGGVDYELQPDDTVAIVPPVKGG